MKCFSLGRINITRTLGVKQSLTFERETTLTPNSVTLPYFLLTMSSHSIPRVSLHSASVPEAEIFCSAREMLKTIQENLVYNQQNVFLQMPHSVIDKSSQKNATKTLLQSCRVGVKRIVQSCKQVFD